MTESTKNRVQCSLSIKAMSPRDIVERQIIISPINIAFFLPIFDIVVAFIGVNRTPESSKEHRTIETIVGLTFSL
jgi:hypothetical protein